MSEVQIERDIFIAAAPERVWPLVAEPGFWATDDDAIRGTQAQEGQGFVARHSEHGEFPMRIEKRRCGPPRRTVATWSRTTPGAGNPAWRPSPNARLDPRQ